MPDLSLAGRQHVRKRDDSDARTPEELQVRDLRQHFSAEDPLGGHLDRPRPVRARRLRGHRHRLLLRLLQKETGRSVALSLLLLAPALLLGLVQR